MMAIDVRFRLGVRSNGAFRCFVNVEAATAPVFNEGEASAGKQPSRGK